MMFDVCLGDCIQKHFPLADTQGDAPNINKALTRAVESLKYNLSNMLLSKGLGGRTQELWKRISSYLPELFFNIYQFFFTIHCSSNSL